MRTEELRLQEVGTKESSIIQLFALIIWGQYTCTNEEEEEKNTANTFQRLPVVLIGLAVITLKQWNEK